MTVLDHVNLKVSDFERLLRFYEAALQPLGIRVAMRIPAEAGFKGAGFGDEGKPVFWVSEGGRTQPPVHVCFAAKDRAAVDAFYAAALAAGASDNGPPGLRPIYHPNYYGAFVRDPDGHNIEACCHHPE